MPFSIQCPNKGCGKIQAPYLDPQDDKVYCSLCEKEITNVTHFVKLQMKSLKQFKPKSNKPFAVQCQYCGKNDRPKLVQNDIVCAKCNKPLDHLSEPFKIMLRDKLKTTDKDV